MSTAPLKYEALGWISGNPQRASMFEGPERRHQGLKETLFERCGNSESIAGLAAVVVIAALMSMPAEAASVEVQFPEGPAHGFLLVRSLAGETIGQGEMTQVIREEGLVENHLVFRFNDGSLHDEKVAFSQLGV